MLNSTKSGETASRIDNPSFTYIFAVVAATIVVLLLSATDLTIFGLALPRIKAELRLSDGALGLLSGVPFAVCFALFGIPTAWLGDTRFRRSAVVAVALAVWSAMTALCGVAGGFWSLFLLRVGVGAGEASGRPAALSVVTELTPESWRRRVIAICTLGTTFGSAVGVAITALAIGTLGWRWTFVVLGVPGVLVAPVYFLVVREPPRPHAARASSNFLTEMRGLLSSRSFLMLFIGAGFMTWFLAGLGAWMPTYLMRAYKVSFAELGAVLGTTGVVTGVVGPIIYGWLADRLSGKDERWPLWMCAVNLLGAVVLQMVILSVNDKLIVYGLIVLSQLLLLAIPPLFTVAAQDSMPTLKATALAVIGGGGVLIGALAPWAVGAISDAFSSLGEQESLRRGLFAVAPLSLLGVLAFWAAARFRLIERANAPIAQGQPAE